MKRHKMNFRNPKSFLLACVAGIGTAVAARGGDDSSSWLAHNDVIYSSPALLGWEGIPLGNGTLGAQVWNPDGMLYQFNTPWSGALNFSLTRLRLMTTPGFLSRVVSYKQHFSLLTATLLTEIETKTGTVRIKSWMPAGAGMT